MIRLEKDGDKIKKVKEFSCIEKDKGNFPKKSTGYSEKLPTSSTMYVIDTREMFMYSEDTDEWYPM